MKVDLATDFSGYPDSIDKLTDDQRNTIISGWYNRMISLPLCNLWDLGLCVKGMKTFSRYDRELYVLEGTRSGVEIHLYDAVQISNGQSYGLDQNQFHAFRDHPTPEDEAHTVAKEKEIQSKTDYVIDRWKNGKISMTLGDLHGLGVVYDFVLCNDGDNHKSWRGERLEVESIRQKSRHHTEVTPMPGFRYASIRTCGEELPFHCKYLDGRLVWHSATLKVGYVADRLLAAVPSNDGKTWWFTNPAGDLIRPYTETELEKLRKDRAELQADPPRPATEPCLTLAVQDKRLLWNHLVAEIRKALPARDFLSFRDLTKYLDANTVFGSRIAESPFYHIGLRDGIEYVEEHLLEESGKEFSIGSEENAFAFRRAAQWIHHLAVNYAAAHPEIKF